ncbi:MAG: hypothetical protein AAFZ92_01690 [Pseudomonadota bacterium]
MLERQRLHYLSTLGIDNYMPRRLLRGSADSHLLSDEQLAEPVFVSADASSATDIAEAKPVDVSDQDTVVDKQSLDLSPQRLVDAGEETLPKHTTISASKPEQSLQQQADAKVEFVLRIWRINEACLVVDSHQPGTALPTDQLLLNMLRAIGYSLVQLPQSDSLRWPLFTGKHFTGKERTMDRKFKDSDNNDAEEARAMVQAYMTAQKAKGEPTHLLLMGESAFSYVLSNEKIFEQSQGQLISDQQWSTKIAVTPSLMEMLEQPLTKAVAWKALKQY